MDREDEWADRDRENYNGTAADGPEPIDRGLSLET